MDSYAYINGNPSISLSIQKQSTANTVKVSKAIMEEVNALRLNPDLEDIEIAVIYDSAEFINKSIENVASTAIIGGILAILILFVFLRNIRSTLIIGLSIPISIIVTFAFMFFIDITLNIVSLGGLALGVGMLVDNSIVVLENIYRHREKGKSRIDAADYGTTEIGMAVVASTLTTIVVFLPIVFVEGWAAKIFKELALTVTFSLTASLIVALTLVPMMASKILKVEKIDDIKRKKITTKIFDKWSELLDKIDLFYRKVLNWTMNHRKKAVVITLAVFIGTLIIPAVGLVGMEFFPATDQGNLVLILYFPKEQLLKKPLRLQERFKLV